MNKLLSELIVTILLLQLSVAQRISEKKCREYSEIRSTKPYSHVVWIGRPAKNGGFSGSIGVLISDQYILTVSHTDLIVNQSHVRFIQDEKINIVERHSHPLYANIPHHDIGLLKLERKVELDGNHRPACLWTNKKIDDTEANLITWNGEGSNINLNDPYSTLTEQLLTESVCGALVIEQNGPLLCTLPLHTRDSEDSKYEPARGSPIQVEKTGFYIPNNYYILGIYAGHNFIYDGLNVGPKTYVHLDWIENIVWPVKFFSNICSVVQILYKK